MTVWRLDTGELKRSSKDAVKMVEATVQLGAISYRAKAEEMQIEALKEALQEELFEMCMDEENRFRSDPRIYITRPICIAGILQPPDQAGESIGERRDRRQEYAQDAREILEAM